MSYQVTCTFDLKNASSQDYTNAYADLKAIGLSRVIKGDSGQVVIPTTMTMGYFDAASAGAARDAIRSRVSDAFKARKLKSEIFVTVGGDWAWGSTTT